MRFILFCLLILLTFATKNFAQDYKDVTDQELKMSTFDKDPNADAVILYERSDMKINSDFLLIKDVFRKIKILTESGKEYANIRIKYWHEDKMNDLSATSYAPNGDEMDLDDDKIVTTETNRWNERSFTIPGVVVGSVIEYEYEIISEYITTLEPWLFQHPIYTKESCLNLILPTGFKFQTLSYGFDLYNIEKKEEEIINPSDVNSRATQFTLTGKNIPGLKDEPYLDNLYDVSAKIIFMLESYGTTYQSINVAKSWDEISDFLIKFYKNFWDSDLFSDKVLSSIINSNADPIEKAKKIYAQINSSITTSGKGHIISSNFKSPEVVLKDKAASSNEKTILLISALKKAGLNAYPVLISSIQNGTFNPDFHNPDQFDKIICSLNINNQQFYLFPVMKSVPFGYLTPETNVAIGLLLNDNNAKIVKINPLIPFNRKDIKTVCQFKNNKDITGNTQITYEGYEAFFERNKAERESPSDLKSHIKNMIEHITNDAVVDTFYYTNLDSVTKPLELTIKYSLPDYVSGTGNIIYIKAPLYTALSENPFVQDKRQVEVDYPYRENVQEKIIIKIPNNMKSMDIPLGSGGSIPELSFSRLNSTHDNEIDCERNLVMYDRRIPRNHYQELKELYNKIVSSDQEQIVLSESGSK